MVVCAGFERTTAKAKAIVAGAGTAVWYTLSMTLSIAGISSVKQSMASEMETATSRWSGQTSEVLEGSEVGQERHIAMEGAIQHGHLPTGLSVNDYIDAMPTF